MDSVPGVSQGTKPPSPWMTAQEVADFLECHPDSVYKMRREGTLPFRRHGLKGLRFPREAIEALKSVAQTAAAPASSSEEAALHAFLPAGRRLDVRAVARDLRQMAAYLLARADVLEHHAEGGK